MGRGAVRRECAGIAGEHMMNLRGKTRQQVEQSLANRSRSELLDFIFSLLTVEQWFKPSEIAARSCLNKRAVLKDIRDGKFGDYYCRAENSIAVPASGVNQWRQSFCVPANLHAPTIHTLATLTTKSGCKQILQSP